MQHEASLRKADIEFVSNLFNVTVLVAGLGYFVDIYDLLIFNAVRQTSLISLGFSGPELTNASLFIMNAQMIGLVCGGFFWGMLGDIIGRKKCLLGSIILYSIGSFALGFVHDENSYALLRFLTALGLAGETGIGITLIVECMTPEKRGMGIAIFTFMGISGAVVAGFIASYLNWRYCYIAGGVAGMAMLLLRSLLPESSLFKKLESRSDRHASLWSVISHWSVILRYLWGILPGAPLMFVVGILWTLAPEISKALNVIGEVKGNIAIGTGYTGLLVGDILVAILSQRIRSRKKVIAVSILTTAALSALLLSQSGLTSNAYYFFCGILGVSVGYYVNLTSISAEQFGTNIRATIATSTPNMIRATLLPLNLLFKPLKISGVLYASWIVGGVATLVALIAISQMKEHFGREADYIENL